MTLGPTIAVADNIKKNLSDLKIMVDSEKFQKLGKNQEKQISH